MIVETRTFRLADGATDDSFLVADSRVQTEALPNRPGFLRRTTARAADGEWLVVTLWGTEQDAVDADAATADHPAVLAFDELVDRASVIVRRYVDRGG
ncbi:MAG TPA: hypothetical protein VF230_17445 [Acidimicrobiales bacterium]